MGTPNARADPISDVFDTVLGATPGVDDYISILATFRNFTYLLVRLHGRGVVIQIASKLMRLLRCISLKFNKHYELLLLFSLFT